MKYFRAFYPPAPENSIAGLDGLLKHFITHKDKYGYLLCRSYATDKYEIILSFSDLERISLEFPSGSKEQKAYKKIISGGVQHCERCWCYFVSKNLSGFRNIDGVVSKSSECPVCNLLSVEIVIETAAHRNKGGTPGAIAYQKNTIYKEKDNGRYDYKAPVL